MKAVRIKYWVQDTIETGHWELTGLLKEKDAEKTVHLYERGEVIDNNEDY